MHTLAVQVTTGPVTTVETPFRGQWEWCVALIRADPEPNLHLEFGPTAVAQNEIVTEPVTNPDYTKIFVSRQAAGGGGIDRLRQTDVGLKEVLNGLSAVDLRLRNALLAITAT